MGNTSSCCSRSSCCPCTSSPPGEQQTQRKDEQKSHNLKTILGELNQKFESAPSTEIDHLIGFIQDQLSFIEDEEQQSMAAQTADCAASGVHFASQILDRAFDDVHKFQDTSIAPALGEVTKEIVTSLANAHWVMLGLSLVASLVRRWVAYKSLKAELKDVLEDLVDLAVNVKNLSESLSTASKNELRKAVKVIIEGVLVCDDYLSQDSKLLKYFEANAVHAGLQNIRTKLTQRLQFLTASATAESLKHHQAKMPVTEWPDKPPSFNAEGIEDQIEKVTRMLNMKGDDPLLSVVIHGFGGAGKTHLARSVIYEIKKKIDVSNYIYCAVHVDDDGEKLNEQNIKDLQRKIVAAVDRNEKHIASAFDGRNLIAKAIEGTSCFIFVDNVVFKRSVDALLPEDFSAPPSTKIRLLITSQEHMYRTVMKAPCKEHEVQKLGREASLEILKRKVFKKEVGMGFNEETLMKQVAERCDGVPMLLDLLGSYLHEHRDDSDGRVDCYKSALAALKDLKLEDKDFSSILMFVFDNIKDAEVKEAFLDICCYYVGWEWRYLGSILGDSCLNTSYLDTLLKKSLVSKDDWNRVKVHDMLLKLGRKKAKGTRIKTEEFIRAKAHKADLQNIRGLILEGNSVINLDATDLEEMNGSLRYLRLSGCVHVSQPSEKEFKGLRVLFLGDTNAFPFRRASQLLNLRHFHINSFRILNEAISQALQCPHLNALLFDGDSIDSYETHVSSDTWNHVSQLDLLLLKVHSMSPICLPSAMKFPSHLISLMLCSKFDQLASFRNLVQLQHLTLNGSRLKSLPQGCLTLPSMRNLSLRNCVKLETLPVTVGRPSGLRYLCLDGCIRLKHLPDDIHQLTALQSLDLTDCKSLKSLPKEFGKLSGLNRLCLRGCSSLQELPPSFGNLSLRSLAFESLCSLTEIPSTIQMMSALTSLQFVACKALTAVPNELVTLKGLKVLIFERCLRLISLPSGFGGLESLEALYVGSCDSLKELPQGFEMLSALKQLYLGDCKSMRKLPDSFEGLVSLIELFLGSLPIAALPILGPNTHLKHLTLFHCKSLVAFPRELLLESAVDVRITHCPSLPGVLLDKVLQLPSCVAVNIIGSTSLIDRWGYLKEGLNYYYSYVTEAFLCPAPFWNTAEWQRAATTALVQGPCKQSDGRGSINLLGRDPLSLEGCKYVVLTSLPNGSRAEKFPFYLYEQGKEGEQTLFVLFQNVTGNEAKAKAKAKAKENEEDILKVLKSNPMMNVAIISEEPLKRHLCLRHVFFSLFKINEKTMQEQTYCCTAKISTSSSGEHKFLDVKILECETEDDERKAPPASSGFSVYNIPLIEEIAKMKQQSNEERPDDTELLLQAMTSKNLDVLIDKRGSQCGISDIVKAGRALGVFQGNLSVQSFLAMRHFQETLKIKMIWIAHLSDETRMGSGSYAKMIQDMPESCWAPSHLQSRLNPSRTSFCVFSEGGRMLGNGDIFDKEITFGSAILPSEHQRIQRLHQQLHEKPAWPCLLGDEIPKSTLSEKMVFVYIESPNKPYMELVEKLERLSNKIPERKFDVLFVGYMNPQNPMLSQCFEVAREELHGWSSLSFDKAVPFWFRFWAKRKHNCNRDFERANLVWLENGEVITEDGRYVVDKILAECVYMENDEDEMIREELMQCLRRGKSSDFVKEFLKDEIKDQRVHRQHPLRLLFDVPEIDRGKICDDCARRQMRTDGRIYHCQSCEFNLCEECWKTRAFAKAKGLNAFSHALTPQ